MTAKPTIPQKPLSEMKRAMGGREYAGAEHVWNYLIADLLLTSDNKYKYLQLFTDGAVNLSIAKDIRMYGDPTGARKEPRGAGEGFNSVDLAFGAIQGLGNANTGLGFNAASQESWVCFVDAELMNDTVVETEVDLLGAGLLRKIENLLCLQSDGAFPHRLFFTMLTPRVFKTFPTSRLYGYKMRDWADPGALFRDLMLCRAQKYGDRSWRYPDDIAARISRLTLNWVTYEEIIEEQFGITGLDLTDAESHPAVKEKIRPHLRKLMPTRASARVTNSRQIF